MVEISSRKAVVFNLISLQKVASTMEVIEEIRLDSDLGGVE